MSRRSGQNGRIEKKAKAYYARFWLDVPGEIKRIYKSVRICPVSGPGSLNKFELKRRLKEIVAEFDANSETVYRQAEAANLGTTFKQQAGRWLQTVQTRKRKPIKPRTADAWAGYLKYINLQIGEMPLSEVNNLAGKEFVARMAAEKKNGRPRFASKSITNYLQVIQMVVGSALNDKGEAIYPVKWNHYFMDVPEIGEQNSPALTAEEVSIIISKSEGYLRTLYILLAGTGLRIEEAVGLQVEDLQGSVLHVRHSHWNGKLYSPKTDAGIREVDLHPSLASLLREHIGARTRGFVFQSSRGTPLARSNVLRRSLHKILLEMGLKKSGFHGFRRFRINHLRNERVTEVLLRIWVGHATHGITDRYTVDALKRDVKLRRETAEQVGLGFHMPDVEAKLPVAPSALKLHENELAASA
ncbi:MAG: site-specific integrase [Candidatus Sulfotelmatobacter sp.]|jgi:integrase